MKKEQLPYFVLGGCPDAPLLLRACSYVIITQCHKERLSQLCSYENSSAGHGMTFLWFSLKWAVGRVLDSFSVMLTSISH